MSSGKLRAHFDEIDTNGSGSLDADELLALMGKLGIAMKRTSIVNLMRLVDENHDGTLDWEEFRKVVEAAMKHAPAKTI